VEFLARGPKSSFRGLRETQPGSQLATVADELASILAATLEVDDFFELEQLRVTAHHPPFARMDLEVETRHPAPISAPAAPVFVEPEAPKGISGVFGRKKHAEALAAAQAAFAAAHQAWESEATAVPVRQLAQTRAWEETDRRRVERLDEARRKYRHECAARDAEAAKANQALDELISGLQAGTEAAIQDYVGIVLGNSVYPDILAVEHEFEFDSKLKELTLTVLVAPPDRLPLEKEYKFVKAKDEITATQLPKTVLKSRYAGIVHQVALRTTHEIFEADRTGHINTIALTVATETNDPATGLNKRLAFVAVAAERASFVSFDLANIVPLATLRHLGASVSKDPYDLVAIDDLPGVRGR